MNITIFNFKNLLWAILLVFLFGCVSTGTKNSNTVIEETDGFKPGTYGYDVSFLKENNIEILELKDENTGAQLLLAPGFQGRVMTSSANFDQGISFGWINYDLIQSGEVSEQFNPVGGEERFWLGPEGGPFSIYFKEGNEQVYPNWKVPPVIDTERFDIIEKATDYATFEKNAILENASGTNFNLNIKRTISLLAVDAVNILLNTSFTFVGLDVVAYQSENNITNTGNNAWTKEGGLLSIWILSMFNPSPATTVFIPYDTTAEGPIVNDEYFGKVPSDRLIVEPGIVYFKIDGKYRSKIGITPARAKNLCGSYDSERNVLTLVWGTLPKESKEYVNSKWGEQDNPYDGDAINAYNDGPVEDGSIMGPFYEIETSSPGADLQPGQSLNHTHVVIHIQGDEAELARLINELFNLNLSEIATKFQ